MAVTDQELLSAGERLFDTMRDLYPHVCDLAGDFRIRRSGVDPADSKPPHIAAKEKAARVPAADAWPKVKELAGRFRAALAELEAIEAAGRAIE